MSVREDDDLVSRFRRMEAEEEILSYRGAFSQRIMVDFGRMVGSGTSPLRNIRTELLSVFVELTENIQRYSLDREWYDEHEVGVGMVQVTRNQTSIRIRAGNRTSSESAGKLQEAFARYAGMDKATLRLHYRDARKERTLERGGSAGLGLIEIARRAATPPRISIEPYDDDSVFAVVEVHLNTNEPCPA